MRTTLTGWSTPVTSRIYGATLEQEERIRAREAELERISAQAELGTQGWSGEADARYRSEAER